MLLAALAGTVGAPGSPTDQASARATRAESALEARAPGAAVAHVGVDPQAGGDGAGVEAAGPAQRTVVGAAQPAAGTASPPTHPAAAHAASFPSYPTVGWGSSPAHRIVGGRAAGAAPDAAGAAADPGAAGSATMQQAATTGSAFVPITPQRVLDSRDGSGGTYLQPYQTQTVTVTTPAVLAAAGLSSAATVRAVVINVTATLGAGGNFLTVWPAGQAWPGSSNLNLERAGQTVANLVTTPVVNGQVHVMASNGTHVVADVQGLYVESSATATAGRLVPLGPVRAYDTRLGPGPFASGEERVVDLSGVGVPVDASAAVLTVTVVLSPDAGYWTVWPAERSRPLASNLNPERPGHTVANQVISGLDGARIRLMGLSGGHVLVDVAGYMTGPGAAAGTDGLFVPVTPARLGDTRVAGAPGSQPDGSRPGPGSTTTVVVAGRGGVPSTGVTAVAINVTATMAGGAGYLTVWPAGAARPLASNMNPQYPGHTLAVHAVSPLGSGGAVSLFTHESAHLITDVAGYFTATVDSGFPSDPPFPITDVKPGPQPAAPPTTGPHSFLYRLSDGTYARWNPCAVIRYAVNDDRALDGQRRLLEDAVLDAEAATGLDLVYVGETSAGLDGKPPSGADVVLAFTDSSASPQMGNAVGLGGGTYRASGVVTGFALFVNSYGTTASQQDLLLHEIGHMLGLNHVDDSTQVMYPYVVPRITYNNGDREGLWWMGAAQGCTTMGTASGTSATGSPDPLLETWSDGHPPDADHS